MISDKFVRGTIYFLIVFGITITGAFSANANLSNVSQNKEVNATDRQDSSSDCCWDSNGNDECDPDEPDAPPPCAVPIFINRN